MSITNPETGEENFPHVRLVIPISILKENKFRSVSYNDAAPGKSKGGGDVQPVSKDFYLIALTITISVLQNLDAVITLAAVFNFIGVVHTFSHPKAAAFIPLHVDGVYNLWFGSKKFQIETHWHLSILHALGRWER